MTELELLQEMEKSLTKIDFLTTTTTTIKVSQPAEFEFNKSEVADEENDFYAIRDILLQNEREIYWKLKKEFAKVYL